MVGLAALGTTLHFYYSVFDGFQDPLDELVLEVPGIGAAVAQPDEDEVLARQDESIVVVPARGHHEILRCLFPARIDPPLGPVGRVDLRAFPGEVVIAVGDNPLAGPLASMEGELAES